MIITTATNKKVREILKSVRDGSLIPRPEFQRRLVWTGKDKDRFIESVVKGFPFPEIYMCNGDVDTETGEGTQMLVDGLQRISTLKEYFFGDRTFTHVLTVPYKELSQTEKESFLEYNVVVRDLGNINKSQVIEVFKRLNSTQYTLREMEINNAIYDGSLKKFCERTADNVFFENHRIFSASDRRRMGDVGYCLSLLGTMMMGYFNRDDEHEGLLSRFNESFPDENVYEDRINNVIEFIEECGFDERSRIWKKADLFSAFIEIDNCLVSNNRSLEPMKTVEVIEEFFKKVDDKNEIRSKVCEIYYKSALQASNDKANRIRRGIILSGILHDNADEEIMRELKDKFLIDAR